MVLTTRERTGENGDVYRIDAKLVHALILAIFGAIVTIGGYMIAWDRSYAAKVAVDIEWRGYVTDTLDKILVRLDNGVIERLDERVNSLNARVEQLEKRNDIHRNR
jgi:hypothetical protein